MGYTPDDQEIDDSDIERIVNDIESLRTRLLRRLRDTDRWREEYLEVARQAVSEMNALELTLLRLR